METGRIISASLSLLNVRKQEGKPVMLLFLHHFSLGIGVALFYTAANVLFLSNYDISYLPYVYLMAAVLMIVAARAYQYVEHHYKVTQTYILSIIFLLVSVILFWLGLKVLGYLWIIFMMLAWHRSIYLVSNLEFWGVSSSIFDIRQSKRLFSLISAGDVPAKLLGYLSVTALVPFVGTENLLILSIVSFGVSIYVLQRILNIEGVEQALHHQESDNIYEIKSASFSKRFFRSDLVKALCYLSLWASLAFMILNYAFLHEVQGRFKTEGELAQFFGLFYAIGNAIILLSKVFLTGRLVNKIGIKTTLILSPLLILCFSFFILFTGSDSKKIIWIFMIMMLLGEVLQYSLYYPVFLALFQPLKTSVRNFGHIITKGIFEPIGLFIAGLALLVVFNFLDVHNLYYINIFLLISLLGWIAAVFYTGRVYLGSLRDAVKQRFVEGTELGLKDKAYETILETKLNSNYPEEVTYALQMLERTKTNKDYKNYLLNVLKHPNDDVVIYASNKTGEYKLKEAMPEINSILAAFNVSPKVKASAIKTYCMINMAETEPIIPFLETNNYEIKSASIVNLLQYGGLDAIMAAGKELEQLMNGDVNDKISAAKILGELKNPQLYKLIVRLLFDEDTNVQNEALTSCRYIKHPKLLSYLLGMMQTGHYSSRLKTALQAHGEEAAEEIYQFISKETDRHKITFLVQVLGGVKNTYSENALLSMINYPDIDINEKVLNSLYSVQFNNRKYEAKIKPLIENFLTKVEWIYAALPYLFNDKLVRNALIDEIDKTIKLLLYLLSFLYDRASIKKAISGIDSKSRNKRADALEILDTLLPGDLFNRFNWIAGSRTIDEKIHHFSVSYLNTSHDILSHILKRGEKEFHPWTITTAVHALEIEEMSQQIKDKYATYHLESVRKIYHKKVNKLNEDKSTTITMVHKDQHLSQVERVIILKSTSLFADTPDNILAEIAGIVKEVRIGSDTQIFAKGDDGDCMYIIYEGEVSIHDGNHEYAVLKNRDFFGELALLDSESRSTSATAKKETLLLKIDQFDFIELISDRSEVAKGILTILSLRIRKQNELIKELKAKLNENS
ncbi:MAG: cyclic nucleotide-binding domain-containing protein [Bacteroidia bacterium]